MKKQLLLFAMILLPLVASAHDIEVQNADGVTIYYDYRNDGTELFVTFRGANFTTYANEYTGNVVIPEEVVYKDKTYKVTSISNFAFRECSKLTSITIPNSVTEILRGAFHGCTGLTSIPIPNSVTYIAGSAFRECSQLTSITIPNGVKGIDDYTFSGCTGLTSVTIPNSVVGIGYSSFAGCSSLTSINIPNSMRLINESAFNDCTGLISITIPNSVTWIGSSAFEGCTGLTTVTIPNSVTEIGGNAFDRVNLTTIISLIENPFTFWGISSDHRVFSANTFNNATLYVPVGTIDKYKATKGWRDFNNIVEGVPSGIKDIHLDGDKNYTIYDINGRHLQNPQKGINIINGKKIIVK